MFRKNIGNATANRFTVTYFPSSEKNFHPFMKSSGNERSLGKDDVGKPLPPRESRKSSSMKTYSVAEIAPGKYWFGIYVDSQNSVFETDEDNNIQYWKDHVTIGEHRDGSAGNYPFAMVTQTVVVPTMEVTQIPTAGFGAKQPGGANMFRRGEVEV